MFVRMLAILNRALAPQFFLFKILVTIKFFVQKYLIAALFFGVISFIKPQVLNSEMILQNNIGR